jgi:O-acetyl-ADP-ribose deacetylase (regulator of RNase III)
VKVEIVQGDLTEIGAEAIVNAANSQLQMGGGVAYAIRFKGGEVIQREADEIGPIEVGEAAVTGAGRLRANHVIHAAVMGLDLVTDEEKIRMATRNAMKRAVELRVDSVAFPALGTGVGKFPMEQAARIMLEEVSRFRDDPGAPSVVIFVLYTREHLESFRRGIYGEEKEAQ